MSNWKKFLSVILVLVLVLGLPAVHINASVGSCGVGVGPGNIAPNSSGTLSFTINNNGGSASIVWIRITSPSGNFTVTGASKDGWTVSYTSSSATFTGGSHAVGATVLGYNVNVTTGAETAAASWTVETSDVADGSGAITCSGDTLVAISTSGPDRTPPSIVGSVTKSVSSSSVTLSWTTDEAATSVIDYGLTDSFGQSQTGGSTTSHSITISGLSSSTTYIYSITIRDAAGNGASTDDDTFTTSTGATTTTTTTPTTTTTTSTKAKKDTTPPSLKVSTSFSKPFKKTPLISGTTTDDTSVSKVEYSIDGKSWLPIDITKGSSIAFSFKPPFFEDGDYQVSLRAEDSAGNVSEISTFKFVIDQLPPQMGGILFSLGPQILYPSEKGMFWAVAGLPQKFTLSAIGGPIKVEIVSGDKSFPLSKNTDSGLWSGDLSILTPGVHKLSAKSLDGAENETTRELGEIFIVEAGEVRDATNPIPNAQVTLYVFETSLGEYIVWDGASFSQENPQKTDQQGNYRFFAPSGKYYLEVDAAGFVKERSKIFKIGESLPINTKIVLEKPNIFERLFAFSGLVAHEFEVNLSLPQTQDLESPLLGKTLPEIKTTILGEEFSESSLKEKGIITFLTSWLPQTAEQLGILQELGDEVELLVVMPHESQVKTDIFAKRGDYKVLIMGDPEGTLLKEFQVGFLPTHFIVRDGVVKAVKLGVLSKEELQEVLKL